VALRSVSLKVGGCAPADVPVAATRLCTLFGLAPVVTSCEATSRLANGMSVYRKTGGHLHCNGGACLEYGTAYA